MIAASRDARGPLVTTRCTLVTFALHARRNTPYVHPRTNMRTLTLLSLLLALSLHADLWSTLEPGPYTAGFTQLERSDASRPFRTPRRLDGTLRNGDRARPIRISIWYPAQKTNGTALTFGDYLDLVAEEQTFAPVTADDRRRAEDAFFGAPLLNTLTKEQRANMRPLAGRAIRDARPVDGKFPVLLYSLGSAAIAHVTPEYLASHGYVVVQSPRLGAFAGLPQDNRDALDLETKLRDIDFVINEMRAWKQADLTSLASLGFSAGGRWALAAAMKYPDVKAVVSLDSVMLFDDPLLAAWRTMPHFNLDAVRVPVLHMTRKEFADQDSAAMWKDLRYADRTQIVYEPGLDHWDFQSLGLATAMAGARGQLAPRIEQTFVEWNRNTLAFLDQHLKGGKAFEAKNATHIAALPAPITAPEFLGAFVDEGTDVAIAAFKKTWQERGTPPVAEAVVNVVGYNLLFGGRATEGLRVLELNVEAYPRSSNTYDSLADAHLALGNRAKALELTKKAAEMLSKETGLNEQRRAAIQASIDGKLKELGGG